jgi:site-specific DNA recombinase
VSVERQLHSGRRYAEARGWAVVGEFVDAGVSATYSKPASRAGWTNLVTTSTQYDAVVIWKVDRLARRVIDFLNADVALRSRSAAIVCVEQSIDMTTGEGRAFAQMLAVFGELESAAISSRVSAARAHLVHAGRQPGGVPLYGWRSVPNPAGAGKVLAYDPVRIGWARAIVERAMRAESIYSIVRWLESEHAPRPVAGQGSRTSDRWVYGTVKRFLHHPLLGGMTLFNPGNGVRGAARDVLRGPDGEPIVNHALAIISVEQRQELLRILSSNRHPAAVPAARRVPTSPLLAQLVSCGHCDRLMRRAVVSGNRPAMKCPGCMQVIAIRLLGGYVTARLLEERGSVPIYVRRPGPAGDTATTRRLARIETDLRTAAHLLLEDGADSSALYQKIDRLKTARAEARRATGETSGFVLMLSGNTVTDLWRSCRSDEQRREVLSSQIDRLVVVRGHRGGRYLDPRRVGLRWKLDPNTVVPDGLDLLEARADSLHSLIPDGDRGQWVSRREAARILGCSVTKIDNAITAGRIERRVEGRSKPSLSLASVLALPRFG